MNLKSIKQVVSDLSIIAKPKMCLPVLSCIRLDTNELHATNLDIGVTISIETGLTRQWVVNAKNLKDILRTTKKSFEFYEDEYDYNLYAISDNQKIRLQTVDPADFPVDPAFHDCNPINMSNFGKGIKSIAHAVCDGFRYNLDTICVYDGNARGMIATDGHKLALYGHKLHKDNMQEYWDNTTKYLLPSESIPFLLKQKSINLNSINADISYNKKFMRLYSPGTMIVIRLREGDFPEFPRVIPSYSNNKHVVIKQELLDILEKALPLTKKTDHTISVTLNGSMQIQVVSDNPAVFNGTCFTNETVTCQKVESIFLINAQYVLDTIRPLDSDMISIGYSSPGKPIEFIPTNNSNQYSLVMPLRK